MGVFDFFSKRRERKEERGKDVGKRAAALIEEVRGWVHEDLENRSDLVCIAAVTGTLTEHGIARAERQWRWMMAEHNSYVQSSEEVEGGV